MFSPESPETTRQGLDTDSSQDIVRAAWRHAGVCNLQIDASRFLTMASDVDGAIRWVRGCVVGCLTCLSEVPCRVSSDVHQRRNDLGAVSTADSVKLKWR